MFGGTTIYGNPHMMVNKVTSPHSPRYLPGESASIRSLFGEKKDLHPPENEDDNGKRKPWLKMSARSCWFTACHLIAVILWFVGVYWGKRITVFFEINEKISGKFFSSFSYGASLSLRGAAGEACQRAQEGIQTNFFSYKDRGKRHHVFVWDWKWRWADSIAFLLAK